jgi:molecular chaperone Hsp33
MIHSHLTPEDMIDKISDGDYTLLEHKDIHYKCNCSKDKFEKGLIALGKDELRSLQDEQEHIETTCHFCSKTYHFSKEDINRLIEESKN